jgi:hypothetical protein
MVSYISHSIHMKLKSFCLAGHIHWVVSLDLHPSQDLLLSASVDNTLRNVLMALLIFNSLTIHLTLFNTVFWIRICIDFGWLDPDLVGQK